MRLTTLTHDFRMLRSDEDAHREHPNTFWFPAREARTKLQIGQAAKLIFDIEGEDEHGQASVQGERLWVIVADKIDDYSIGILDHQPAAWESADATYSLFWRSDPLGGLPRACSARRQ